MGARVSPIWKYRILDLIRIAAIILCFYTIMLVITGDWTKYNMPLIITVFMSVTIVCIVLLGEKIRTDDPVLKKLQDEWVRQKNRN